MGAKTSAEMKHAVQLARTGTPVYAAATQAGVFPSSLYKVLNKLKKKKDKKIA